METFFFYKSDDESKFIFSTTNDRIDKTFQILKNSSIVNEAQILQEEPVTKNILEILNKKVISADLKQKEKVQVSSLTYFFFHFSCGQNVF